MTFPSPKPGILEIKPYVGGKSKAEAARTLKLSSNENPHGPSPKATAAYSTASAALHRYPDGGHTQLREAIALAENLPAEQIVCGAGSDELIGLLIHAYAGAGDEVLYSAHGFLMYKIYALSNGATPVTAAEKNLTADIDAMLAAVTPRTRIVFLANPNNPTGSLVPHSEVVRLRAGLRSDIILALDAAYAEYLDAPEQDGRALVAEGTATVVLHTFSKIHGLPALRVGWAYAPPQIVDVLNRVRGPFNVSAPALAAASAAIADHGYREEMRRVNAQERARVSEGITRAGFRVYPSHANFVLVEFPQTTGQSAAEANAFLLSQGIIVREVAAYGLPHCLRMTIGTAEENTILLDALTQFAQACAA